MEDLGPELLKDSRWHVLERKTCGVRPLRFPPFLFAGIHKFIILRNRGEIYKACFLKQASDF